MRLCSALVLCVALGGCQGAPTAWQNGDAQPTSELHGEDGCFDGADSDGDGLVDCADPDCEYDCAAENLPPLISEVRIEPVAPDTRDDLSCTAVASDVDGDPISLSTTWSRDGVVRATGPVLPAAETWGYDTWTCEVVASDGVAESQPVQAVAVVAADNACRSLGFDGSETRAVVPRFAGQDLVGTDFTLEAWVWIDPAGDTGQPIFMSDPQSDLSGWRFVVVGAYGDRAIRLQLGGGVPSLPAHTSDGRVFDGQWTHVAITYDADADLARTFIDGLGSGDGPLGAPVLAGTSVGDLVIGASAAGGPYQFVGAMDELRISTVVRYDGDFVPRIWFEPDGDTLALWHLDDGGALASEAVAGRDGALTGGVWSNSSPCDTLP